MIHAEEITRGVAMLAIKQFSQSVEQMAAGLAHEVKNPLSLVRANIDLLEKYDNESSHAGNYRIMRHEIDRINELLLDFIQFTKPLELGMKKLRPQELIYDVCSAFKESYACNFGFELNYQDEALYINGDESKLRRVFTNIIKNAVEAQREITPEITVSLSTDNGFIKITVADNGPGMDEETLRNINDPFYTTKPGGSGLGLSIVGSIIDQHDGVFDIASKPGEGCTVTIMLPKS